jgi:pimeloyl-ACP methyl ester carboxylesterase
MEPPEAARYHAPILILPGLFQSAICWRGLASILAHRGWEVYLLPRVVRDMASGNVEQEDKSWDEALADVVKASERLGEKLIIFGSDVGAAMALATLEQTRPMALGLFAPTEPARAAASFSNSLGFMDRRRFNKQTGPLVEPTGTAVRDAFQKSDISPEPATFMGDLAAGVDFARPATQPPSIVFGTQNDPAVDTEHSLGFADGQVAKEAQARLVGRWWPSIGWEAASEQVHRFLILTLSDRVVEFPDEIING